LLVNDEIPALSRAFVDPTYRERIETLKHFTFISQIQSPRLQVVEYRGKDIVKKIFEALSQPEGERLLPKDYRLIHDRAKESLEKRTICDFVAGMTDRYALDYYSRITSGDEQTIFKPY
jgi:dGTPase